MTSRHQNTPALNCRCNACLCWYNDSYVQHISDAHCQVYKKASADVSTLQHVKNGVHHRDIYGNEDGGPPLTIGILTVTKHDGGGTAGKAPCSGYVIVTEGVWYCI